MSHQVLITGASSGLGAALARAHARRGHALALLARRGPALRRLAADCRALGAPRALPLVVDVTRAAALRKAIAVAIRRLGGLDWVYANAGYSQAGWVHELSLRQWRRQMAVNVEGALLTAQACLPCLRRSKGRLVFTGSVVAYGSLAGSAAYAASKAALRALAQVLDLELASTGVSVTLATLGYFASEIRLKDRHGRPDARAGEYIPAWLLGDTGAVAEALLEAARRRRPELLAPAHARWAVFFLRHAPDLARRLARRLGEARLRRRQAVQGR
jgi:NAD(P)-dependent dehydrogenase (short-subunit alcohol dehydrogenase family)